MFDIRSRKMLQCLYMHVEMILCDSCETVLYDKEKEVRKRYLSFPISCRIQTGIFMHFETSYTTEWKTGPFDTGLHVCDDDKCLMLLFRRCRRECDRIDELGIASKEAAEKRYAERKAKETKKKRIERDFTTLAIHEIDGELKAMGMDD